MSSMEEMARQNRERLAEDGVVWPQSYIDYWHAWLVYLTEASHEAD